MRVIGRMALIALVIGTSVTVSATERVTLSLVVAGALGWSFVPVLQLLTGVLLVAGSDRLTPSLDRYFATHWPWSLWILFVHAGFLMVPAIRGVGLLFAVTAAVPVIWTVRLLLGLCQTDLGMGRAQAWRRVALHQGATYLLVLLYVSFAVALWPRVAGLVS